MIIESKAYFQMSSQGMQYAILFCEDKDKRKCSFSADPGFGGSEFRFTKSGN